jgi:REP element-mobilizing transposase RayT
MARSLRITYPNAVYHIYARGNRKGAIFFEDRDRHVFLEKLEEALEKYSMICYAYCLMNNHYHLLLRTPEANISRGIHYLNSAYANWVKAKRSLVGVVFQGRFCSILVDEANYVLTLAAYIPLNPVRAEIVKDPRDYPWSSYAFQLGLRSPGQMRFDPLFILDMLDPDPREAAVKFERFVLEHIDMESPFKNLYKGCVLGDKEFIETVKERIKARGRDREIPATADPDETRPPRNASDRLERVASIVAKVMGVQGIPSPGRENHRNLTRDIALYALRRHSPLTLKEIGNYFAMDYVAVHQAVARLTKRLEDEPWLKEKVSEVERRIEEGSGLNI